MGYRLVNVNDPERVVRLNSQTWFRLLERAEEHGWNPMGTLHRDRWTFAGFSDAGGSLEENGSYTEPNRLVVLEDALNLADALYRALLAYEPEWDEYPEERDSLLVNLFCTDGQLWPSLGAMELTAEFCLQGSFSIEKV